MPKSVLSEIYFVAGMMVLIMILSVVSVFYFLRQFRREKSEKVELKNVDREVKFRESTIRNYLTAYSEMNVDNMTADMADDIVFINVRNGIVDMELDGKDAFTAQAEKAKEVFSSRRQSIRTFAHNEDETTVKLDFHGVLARDLSDTKKKGDEISLSGFSVFQFYKGKIIKLTDKS